MQPPENEDGQAGKIMTFLHSFKNSLGTTVLAGLLLSATAFAQAPSQTPPSDPYGPAGPPPDMQQQQGNPQGQYGQPQYGQQPYQGGYAQDPNQQQQP